MSPRKTVHIIFCTLLISAGYFLSTLQEVFSVPSSRVHLIQLDDDTINPVTADYITQSIDRAYEENAQCLIIKMDTPGGLLNSTRLIVKRMLTAKVPVVVYIAPSGSRAGSAGVFITYASHIAAMAPSTNIGAAHPVQMGGGRPQRSTEWRELKELLEELRQEKKVKEESGEKGKIKTDKQREKDVQNQATDAHTSHLLLFRQQRSPRYSPVSRSRQTQWRQHQLTFLCSGWSFGHSVAASALTYLRRRQRTACSPRSQYRIPINRSHHLAGHVTGSWVKTLIVAQIRLHHATFR